MKNIPKIKGYAAAIIWAAIAVIVLGFFKFEGAQYSTTVFFLLPISMGIISSWFWRIEHLNFKSRFWRSTVLTLLSLVLSFAFLGEGAICLLIVSPLLYMNIFIGIVIGWYIFEYRNNNTLNVSLLVVFLGIFIIDLRTPKHFETSVSDEIIINAPPEVVWKYVAEYEPIEKKPDYFLFKMGMPCPVNSTVSAFEQGANRKCIFSNGYVFEEVMTVYNPHKELTFVITDQPLDPEIMGHIDILKGQFLLEPTADGKTKLIGTSWYRLYVFPSFYYNLWAKSITSNVHLRVMEQIKVLSEKDAV